MVFDSAYLPAHLKQSINFELILYRNLPKDIKLNSSALQDLSCSQRLREKQVMNPGTFQNRNKKYNIMKLLSLLFIIYKMYEVFALCYTMFVLSTF